VSRKFLLKLDWPLFSPAAALTPETRHLTPVLLKKKIDIDGRNTEKFMVAVSDSAEIHLYLH